MNSRTLVILSSAIAALAFTACKKEEAAPTTTPPATPPAAAAATPAAAPAAQTAPAATASTSTNAAASAVYDAADASKHVDETAAVKGKVFGVHVTAKGDTFINVGAAYPNAPFTVVHFHSDATITTNDLAALDGKTALFSGKIKDYNGKAEVVINGADQIKYEDGSAFKATGSAADAAAPAAKPADDRGN